MPITDWFARRKKQELKPGADVYRYDNLPREFRVQVAYILKESLGFWRSTAPFHYCAHLPNVWWEEIHNLAACERGNFQLDTEADEPFRKCVNFLLKAETDDALSLIEVAFRYLDAIVRDWPKHEVANLNLTAPDEAIAQLNERFTQHGIGYFYAGGRIGRIDSEYLHTEAVKPALRLLREQGKGFDGPLEEFVKAHECHRKGEQKEAIGHALKAFESTMKSICAARNWTYDAQKDTAKDLIDIILKKNLIPDYLQSHFAGLRSMLEAGIPTVRNRTAGHGQGPSPTRVPEHLATYALHMTATNIVMLVEAHRAMQ